MNLFIKDVEFLKTIQDPEIASKKESIVDVLCKDKEFYKISKNIGELDHLLYRLQSKGRKSMIVV